MQPSFHTLLQKWAVLTQFHELVSDFLVSYERWIHKLPIHINLFPQNHIYFIWQPFQKCLTFVRHPRWKVCFLILIMHELPNYLTILTEYELHVSSHDVLFTASWPAPTLLLLVYISCRWPQVEKTDLCLEIFGLKRALLIWKGARLACPRWVLSTRWSHLYPVVSQCPLLDQCSPACNIKLTNN